MATTTTTTTMQQRQHHQQQHTTTTSTTTTPTTTVWRCGGAWIVHVHAACTSRVHFSIPLSEELVLGLDDGGGEGEEDEDMIDVKLEDIDDIPHDILEALVLEILAEHPVVDIVTATEMAVAEYRAGRRPNTPEAADPNLDVRELFGVWFPKAQGGIDILRFVDKDKDREVGHTDQLSLVQEGLRVTAVWWENATSRLGRPTYINPHTHVVQWPIYTGNPPMSFSKHAIIVRAAGVRPVKISARSRDALKAPQEFLDMMEMFEMAVSPQAAPTRACFICSRDERVSESDGVHVIEQQRVCAVCLLASHLSCVCKFLQISRSDLRSMRCSAGDAPPLPQQFQPSKSVCAACRYLLRIM
jgi:hypothetical protein